MKRYPRNTCELRGAYVRRYIYLMMSIVILCVSNIAESPAGGALDVVKDIFEASRKIGNEVKADPEAYSKINTQTRRLSTPFSFAPWAAGIALTTSENTRYSGFFCGATLISAEWALTAAHCLVRFSVDEVQLIYGAEQLEDVLHSRVAEIIIHPDYDQSTTVNDIALLRLEGPVQQSWIRYPKLPSRPFDELLQTSDARVYGWGSISEGGPISFRLLQIDTTILDHEYCNSPIVYAGRVQSGMLCARAKRAGIDACQGFGGSGLIQESSSGTSQLLGVVSWGEGCGRPSKPTVYSEVGGYERWLRELIEEY